MRALARTLLALAGAGLAAAQESPGEPQRGPPPNGESFELFQGLAAARRIELSVPVGRCEGAAKQLARQLQAGGRYEVSLEGGESDPTALRVLVGSTGDTELVALAGVLGLEPLERGFRLLGREYRADGDAVVAVFEDPARAGLPMCLVLGNDAELVSAYLEGLPRLSRPHLWIHADGELALECPLAPDGTPRADQAIDYLARRGRLFSDEDRLQGPGFVLRGGDALEPERRAAYVEALTRARERTLGWLGTADEVPVVEVFAYAHHEDLVHGLGVSSLCVVNRLRPRVHALVAPGIPDDGGAGLARALARILAGEPAAPWLSEGLAVGAAGAWWGRPLPEWLAHLAYARLLPPPEGLVLNSANARASEHVLLPARALLFLELARTAEGDPRRVRALWKGARTDPRQMTLLYRQGVQSALQSPEARRVAQEEPEAEAETPYRHGLALVESPRAPYGSRILDAALAEACALEPAPDTVSLTVFAAGEDPWAPLVPEVQRTAFASASDAALASAVAGARARGLAVLLSLEVLAHPNGSWADVISWTREDDDTSFFARYERIALHYALLSELLGTELFSLGANLRESTRTEAREEVRDPERLEVRRKGWKELIGRLRGAYRGGLTYAARFPVEAQEVAFFDQLDFLGLLFFPPVAREPGPPDLEIVRRALRYELEQALDLAVRWNRPLLLLQVGYPSRSDSWMRPQTPRGAVDPAAQLGFLEAFAEVLRSRFENGAVLRGFFLWNWPLDPARAGPTDGGFSLRGKPAAAVLPRLFER